MQTQRTPRPNTREPRTAGPASRGPRYANRHQRRHWAAESGATHQKAEPQANGPTPRRVGAPRASATAR
eukprot:10137598-Alexandrium_andersonii.AAC.1